MALVLVLVPWPQSLFYLPFFLLICACGYLHYPLRRGPAGPPARGSTAGPGGARRGAKTAGATPTTGCVTPPGGVGME